MVSCTQTWCGVPIISCLLPVQVVLTVLYLCYSCTRITEGYIRHETLEWVRWNYSVLFLFILYFFFIPFLSYPFTPPSSQGLASFISSPSRLSALRFECCHPFVDEWVCACRNVEYSGECVSAFSGRSYMFIKRKEKFFSLDGTGVFVLLCSPCWYQCCRLTEFNDHLSLQTASRVYLVSVPDATVLWKM